MAAREQLGSAGVKGSPADAWKHHIIRQLKHRDRAQKSLYQDLIRSYMKLLEKSNQKVLIAQGLLGSFARHQLNTSKDSLTSLVSQHQDKVKNLNKTSGELAYKVLELQQEITIKNSVLDEQHARMNEMRSQLAAAEAEMGSLQARVDNVRQENGNLKREYDSLLQQHHDMDEKFREEKVRGSELVEDMVRWKQLAAVKMNTRNEKRVRAREANLQKELEMAAKEKVDIDIGSCKMPSANLLSPKPEVDKKSEKRQNRMFRVICVSESRC